jgi:hypothetical protein
MKQNVDRNKELVEKRIRDPKKWSYGNLGKFYNMDKKTAYEIFDRDYKKYATSKEIALYIKKARLFSRGELSTG